MATVASPLASLRFTNSIRASLDKTSTSVSKVEDVKFIPPPSGRSEEVFARSEDCLINHDRVSTFASATASATNTRANFGAICGKIEEVAKRASFT